jgi:hypothetical protein
MWLVGLKESAGLQSGGAGALARNAKGLNERGAVAAHVFDAMCEKS